MAMVLDVLSWALLAVGSLFCVIGGVGLIRMPGFYSRVHASGLTDTMGSGCILIGLALQGGLSNVTIKLIIILGFLLITSPTAAHALVNGAYTHGLRPKTPDTEGES
jgi:multicomponent Na+:H+ antiporter subunit G